MANLRNLCSTFLLPLLPSSTHRLLYSLYRKVLKLQERIFFWRIRGPPFEALGLILTYIPDRIDRLRFKAVCKSWYLAESLCPPPSMHPPLLIPSLFLFPEEPILEFLDLLFTGDMPNLVELTARVRALSTQFNKVVYRLLRPKGANWALCCGSTCDGWLFMVHQIWNKIFFINFFSGEKIVLPQLGVIPWQEIFPARFVRFLNCFSWFNNLIFLEKAIILSSSQSNMQDCLVAAVNRCGFISLCKPGGISWTTNLTNDTFVKEIIFYKEKLHGINKQEEVYLFNVINTEKGLPKLGNIVKYNIRSRADLAQDIGAQKYIIHLCECNGKLLMVLRYYKLVGFIMKNMKTISFRVFELSETKKNTFEWVELKSLGDAVMFVDKQGARLFPKSNFDRMKEGDCIYFGDDYFADESLVRCFSLKIKPDMGVYSMSDGCIKPFFVSDSVLWCPSMWLFHPKFE